MGDLDISLIHACERNGWSKSFRLSDRTSAARIGHASEFRSVDTVELPHLVLVAGACNASNLLSIPFWLELIRRAA